MRPASIVWFERLYFVSLLSAVVAAYMQWNLLTLTFPPRFLLGTLAVLLALFLLLVLLVSRRRSQVAKWILVILFLIGIPGFVRQLSIGFLSVPFAVQTIQMLIGAVALTLLFTASSRAWLAGKRLPSGTELEQTFE